MLQSLTVWVCSACTCQLSPRPHPTLSTTNNIVHIQLYMSTPPNPTKNQPTSFLQELRSNFERIMGLDMGITNMDTQLQKSWHFVIDRGSWFNLSFQRLQLFCSLSLLTTVQVHFKFAYSNWRWASASGFAMFAVLARPEETKDGN